MKKIIYIIILSSFLFSVNISRINISLDMPSQYNIDLSNLVNGESISNFRNINLMLNNNLKNILLFIIND